jgi:hypothetical protein
MCSGTLRCADEGTHASSDGDAFDSSDGGSVSATHDCSGNHAGADNARADSATDDVGADIANIVRANFLAAHRRTYDYTTDVTCTNGSADDIRTDVTCTIGGANVTTADYASDIVSNGWADHFRTNISCTNRGGDDLRTNGSADDARTHDSATHNCTYELGTYVSAIIKPLFWADHPAHPREYAAAIDVANVVSDISAFAHAIVGADVVAGADRVPDFVTIIAGPDFVTITRANDDTDANNNRCANQPDDTYRNEDAVNCADRDSSVRADDRADSGAIIYTDQHTFIGSNKTADVRTTDRSANNRPYRVVDDAGPDRLSDTFTFKPPNWCTNIRPDRYTTPFAAADSGTNAAANNRCANKCCTSADVRAYIWADSRSHSSAYPRANDVWTHVSAVVGADGCTDDSEANRNPDMGADVAAYERSVNGTNAVWNPEAHYDVPTYERTNEGSDNGANNWTAHIRPNRGTHSWPRYIRPDWRAHDIAKRGTNKHYTDGYAFSGTYGNHYTDGYAFAGTYGITDNFGPNGSAYLWAYTRANIKRPNRSADPQSLARADWKRSDAGPDHAGANNA